MVKAPNGIPSSIEVLRYQELSPEYTCRDYLGGPHVWEVTAATRREMLEWVQKVSVFMKLQEDIPMLTATLLDRFMQTEPGDDILQSIPQYRLATMACLYLTAKLHEPSVSVSSEVMSAFSQGKFSAAQVEAMEWTVLKALKWHTHPPTALAFVKEFLLLLPCSVSASIKEQAYDLCQAQIQQCLVDYEVFALTEASLIAFFAVHNALRKCGMDAIILGHVAAIFQYATHTDYYSQPEKEALVQNCLLGSDNKNKRRGSASFSWGSSNKNKKRRSKTRRGSATSTSSSRSSWTRRSVSLESLSPKGVATWVK